MLNRQELKADAATLGIQVLYCRYGHPRVINGERTVKPWVELEMVVSGAQRPATIPQITPSPLPQANKLPASVEEVSWEGLTSVGDDAEVEAPPVQPKPAGKHPLRGFRVSTREKVEQALYDLKRVVTKAVKDVRVLARLIAKHFRCDVRLREVEGTLFVLVFRGSSRVAFAA